MRKQKRVVEGQDRLPFRRQQGGLWAYAHPYEKRALMVVGVTFAVLSILYTYFMFSSVMHVAARQQLASQMSKISAEVATLETTYLGKTQNITESYAHSLGYVGVKDRAFAKRLGAVTLHTAR